MTINEILDPELRNALLALVERCDEIYLVGGALRDFLLKRACKDIDFVVKQEALSAARTCADQLGGKFYTLDEKRKTGRVLLKRRGENLVIDFASMSGENLVEDLRARDFTINAMAVDIRNPETLIDPLHGESDLKAGILRPCSSNSFQLDPVRTIRAIRFMQALNMKLAEGAENPLINAATRLKEISAERKRDELFHVFEAGQVKQSLMLMREFHIWDQVLPQLECLDSEQRFPPHVHNLMEHSLQALNYCEILLQCIRQGATESRHEHMRSGCEMLLEFREPLLRFLEKPIHPQRTYDGLLILGVLYHDIGKTLASNYTDSKGQGKTDDHAQASADFFHKITAHWALSWDESDFVERIIRWHSVQLLVNDATIIDQRLQVHRFYRKAGKAGVLLAIFHLADILSAYEDTLKPERWQQALHASRRLLDGWFNHYDEWIEPPALIDGEAVMRELSLHPGKIIGEILEGITEAQVSGGIETRKDALRFAGDLAGKRGID